MPWGLDILKRKQFWQITNHFSFNPCFEYEIYSIFFHLYLVLCCLCPCMCSTRQNAEIECENEQAKENKQNFWHYKETEIRAFYASSWVQAWQSQLEVINGLFTYYPDQPQKLYFDFRCRCTLMLHTNMGKKTLQPIRANP